MEVEQQATGVPDGWEVVSAPKAPEPSKGKDFKFLGVNIHVPAEEKPRPDANMIGWGTDGAGVAPEDALAVGQAGRSIVKGVAAGGALAGVKTAIAEASPVIKYEAARSALRVAGFSDAVATPVAMIISGYRRGGPKGEPGAIAPPSDLAAPHLDRSVPMRPSEMTPQQLNERIAYGQGAPAVTRPQPGGPTVAPVAEPPVARPDVPAPPSEPVARTGAAPSTPETQSPAPTNSLPDQKALNEEALARRRAEYQARQAEAKGQPQAAPKAKLTAPESKEYMRLRQAGQSHPEAMAAIEAQRVFQARYGLSTPSPAETRFPKGQRGKSVSPYVPKGAQ